AGQLLLAATATGSVQPLLQPQGSVRLPRFSPAGERIFCGLDEAAAGRAGRRLCSVHSDGSDPLLVEPGAQWLLDGVDVLAAMAPAPAAAAPEIVDVTGAVIEVASGSIVLGSVRQLTAADGSELVLATQTFENHEVAGINCRFTLPVVSVDDVLALHARIVAR